MKTLLTSLALALSLQVATVCGHGRLVEPPSRASAWRYGFNTPADYNDNQGFCGGAYVSRAEAAGEVHIQRVHF